MSTDAPITPTQEELQQPEPTAVPGVRTFMRRIGFCITCVIPADLLSLEAVDAEDTSDLYTDASQNELSYIRVLRMLEKGLYMVRVAGSPEHVTGGYTVLLTEDQLSYALPWDIRLSSLTRFSDGSPDARRILKVLHAHRAAIQPTLRRVPSVPPVEAAPQEKEICTALHTIFVPERHMQKVLGPNPEKVFCPNIHHAGVRGRIRTQFTLALLQAMLNVTHCNKALHDALSQVLTEMRHTARHIVSIASAVYDSHGRVGYWVVVGAPPSPSVAG